MVNQKSFSNADEILEKVEESSYSDIEKEVAKSAE